jgi:hypothetical protein
VVRIWRPGGGGSFVGTALAAHSGTPGLLFPHQTTMVSRVWEGTLAAVAGAALNDWIVVELGARHLGPTSGGTGAYWGITSIVGGSDLPEVEGTATNLNSWIEIVKSGTGATGGDLPLDVVHQDSESVGTSIRAARCDHQHAHGYLSASETHYHDTSQVEGIEDIVGAPGETVSEVVDHGTMGATEEFSFVDGTDHEGTLDENLTVTLAGATSGEAAWMTLKLHQDGTGTNTLTLPASVVNGDDVEAAFDTAASAVNIISIFTYDGGSTWYAFLAGGSGGASALDDLTDVTISSATLDDDLRFNGSVWVNDDRKWEAVTNGEDIFVWDGDDLVHDWST